MASCSSRDTICSTISPLPFTSRTRPVSGSYTLRTRSASRWCCSAVIGPVPAPPPAVAAASAAARCCATARAASASSRMAASRACAASTAGGSCAPLAPPSPASRRPFESFSFRFRFFSFLCFFLSFFTLPFFLSFRRRLLDSLLPPSLLSLLASLSSLLLPSSLSDSAWRRLRFMLRQTAEIACAGGAVALRKSGEAALCAEESGCR
mmetsp:Transcript_47090/g.120118  ORF Transcript_47090/g.120118 Transcript_47090/m.120118 type:complete len:208 (-) Transcript_47090:11-634(-)